MRAYWNFPKVTQPRLPKDLKAPACAQQIQGRKRDHMEDLCKATDGNPMGLAAVKLRFYC